MNDRFTRLFLRIAGPVADMAGLKRERRRLRAEVRAAKVALDAVRRGK